MRIFIIVLPIICLFASISNAIVSGNRVTINFADSNDAKSKATWSEPNLINITSQGLGWDGPDNALRDGWIITKEIAIGMSWRPPQSASVTVALQPILKTVTLPNGQTLTPFQGRMFMRHSPDVQHWSSWQIMKMEGQKDSKYQYSDEIGIPLKERAKYMEYRRQFGKLDVPWRDDEEALVKWIVAKEPNFFEKSFPFIGYIQILYEGSFNGGQRLTQLDINYGWTVNGMVSMPEDRKMFNERHTIPWRYRGN